MRAEDFELLYNLEESFWWFVAMRRITDSIVAKQLQKPNLRILDAGCGTGINMAHYERRPGADVYGFDISSDAMEWVRKRGFRKVAQASVTEIPFASGTFDLVFSFDVLEQLPLKTLETSIGEMHRVLKPGGFLFLRAPAFEWLKSSHDEDLRTAHRFTRGELTEGFHRAGFKLHRATYGNTLLFPVVVVRRFLKYFGIGRGTDVRPLPAALKWIDPIFRGILSSEAAVLRLAGSLPFGLSVIMYAEKTADRGNNPLHVSVR